MSGDVRVDSRVRLAASELRWGFSPSRGPGGQHADTAETRVTLSFDVARSRSLDAAQRERVLDRLAGRLRDGVATVVVQETRSQARNREIARERLASLVASGLEPRAVRRRPPRPSRTAKARRLAEKRRRSEVKRNRARPEGE
ncbi:ribosome-associated protein [Haloactinospora alba]|uniref:Ribosome-associated protein n=1 Tax=Haloactinospora alba TaxID=405555 RepID=A0A543NI00_9ACTN|nr:alternative ribosome rescue aminoacyl-tRNA hydrolase ArfB [Haloactinospora alba]TQN31478.1 ribosome-associated protein [Haloactinospora alba]